MAIKTVNADNLQAYVQEIKGRGGVVSDATSGDIPREEGVATPGNPVIKDGVAETLPDQPPVPEQKPPTAKKGNPVQPRIDELTREKYELEEFAQTEYEARLQAQARIAELEAQVKANAPKPVEAEELKRPSPKDFTDQDSYDKAMEAYEAKRDERTAARAAAAARAETLLAEQNRALAARIEAAKVDLPDFDEVISRADKRTREPFPNHLRAAIAESDVGPKIAYHLAKNPAEESRILKLSPAVALMELGKIEASYSTKPAKAEAKVTNIETTKAPAPLVTVQGNSPGDISTDLSQPGIPFSKYRELRMEEIRKRRRH